MTTRAAIFLGMIGILASAGCSLGQGEGEVKSDALVARDCWFDAYDLKPDFFAAVPYRSTLNIRVQRGTDLQEVSDGLTVSVDDVDAIREKLIDKPLSVTLSPGVLPPGTTPPPPPPEGQPAVGLALYLHRSCHNQNIVLYAVDGTVTFRSLFSGDPNEADAAEKYTDAEFDVRMGDPRDAPVGGPADAVPKEMQSRVTGFFRFYFERGQPGQPFP
ncbi:hypothetical protein [Polyangium aurulentum]|uniref:hypothetical protein n=1 Tax=Polyangium aurulentum TaxID=2567896 RepID=UPI0010AE2D52|nr:hypothetical protein [Polyangium aurulentum]UQA62357.1 hypothetical protein E8A73_018580 [Polyangium aurulentum]